MFYKVKIKANYERRMFIEADTPEEAKKKAEEDITFVPRAEDEIYREVLSVDKMEKWIIVDLFDKDGKRLDRKYALDTEGIAEAIEDWDGYIKAGDMVKIGEEIL